MKEMFKSGMKSHEGEHCSQDECEQNEVDRTKGVDSTGEVMHI